MLVGNKIDNIHNRVVEEYEGEQLAMKNGMMFIETSAKEKIGVTEAFEEVVNKVLESPLAEDTEIKRNTNKSRRTHLSHLMTVDSNV